MRTYELMQQLNQRKIDLIKTDLDAARTFAQIARDSSDPEKASRNRRNARKGYDTVNHLLSTADVQPGERQTLETEIAALKSALTQLGETFQP